MLFLHFFNDTFFNYMQRESVNQYIVMSSVWDNRRVWVIRKKCYITLYLFKVTLSGKKDLEKHRRRRKEKNELHSDAENDDYDNALNEMKISESQEDVHDSETGKVGDFPVPYMNVSFTINTSVEVLEGCLEWQLQHSNNNSIYWAWSRVQWVEKLSVAQ